MKKYQKIIMAGGAVMTCYPFLLNAQTCTTLPNCPDIGFTVAKANLTTACKDVTYLKCPFGDYYFCSSVDDGCPDFVTVNPSLEKCTKLCPKNSSKCLEKRAITCQEAVADRGGILRTPSQGINGTQTKPIYLTGHVKGGKDYLNRVEMIGASVYSADTLAPCKSEMQGEAFLEVGQMSVKNYVSINVKSQINNISFNNSGYGYSGSISFGADTEVRNIELRCNRNFESNYNISFYPQQNQDMINATVGFYCSGDCSNDSYWNKTTCKASIDGYNANVKYSYYGDCETEVTCNEYEENFTCTQGYY